MDIFEDSKNNSTAMNTDVINCEKYKYNSCPKEIIDFVNQIYIQALRGVDLGLDILSSSNVSDFMEKSRGNAIKQALFHYFLSVLGVILIYMGFTELLTGDYITKEKFSFPWTIAVGITIYTLIVALVFLHFKWYGKLKGMGIERVTKSIVESAMGPFKRWYIGITLTLSVVFLIFVNLPTIILGSILAFGHHIKGHPQVWKMILDKTPLPDYNNVMAFMHNVDSIEVNKFILLGNIFVIAIVVHNLFLASQGFKSGLMHMKKHTDTERAIVERKKEYKFDKALRMLEEEVD